MFRRTDPQATFNSLSVLLSPEKIARLEKKHWAGRFRGKALLVLLANEQTFRPLFCEDNGRPNKPVAATLGLLILKEMFDLTDEAALDNFEFNTSWQYALDLDPDDAHLCQKTLHNFRVKMSAAEAEGTLTYSVLFDEIVQAIIQDKNLRVGKQRLDSTHIRSNMAVLTRLGLFTRTIVSFLKQLRNRHGGMFKSLPAGILQRYIEREGYFADSPSSESRRRLAQCAADVWRLVDRFRGHRSVKGMPGYLRLKRLLNEQCVIEKDYPTDPDGDGPESVPVRPKNPKVEKIPPTSLQGSDDDATYGHKGKGYQVQVAETCAPENEIEVVTHVSVEGAHESDQHAAIPVIDDLEQKDRKVEELLADTNYGRGRNLVDAADRGVELLTPACGPDLDRSAEPEEMVRLEDFVFSADGRRLEKCPSGHAPVEQGVSGQRARESDGFAADDPVATREDLCTTREASLGTGETSCTTREESRGDYRRRYAVMDSEHCARCPHLACCPGRWSYAVEGIVLRWSPPVAATSGSRRRERTGAFKERYRLRSGIEATNSEYKRRYGGGRLRVRGSPAVTRTVKFKFMALNIRRMGDCCAERSPPSRLRSAGPFF